MNDLVTNYLNRLRGMALLHQDRDTMIKTIDDLEAELSCIENYYEQRLGGLSDAEAHGAAWPQKT